MPAPSFLKKCAETDVLRRFPRYVGAGVTLFSLLIIASWHAHWRAVLQMLPDTAPMQFNTALCLMLSGAGLFLLTTSRTRYAPGLAGAAALFALLTLLEYLLGQDFSIDEIFFKPYFEADTVYPGRMSPLAAVCFIFIGSGIALAGVKRAWPHRLIISGVFACIVGVIALVALAGFTFGIEAAYGWGAYSRMAVNSAVAFLLLAGGLLVWAWAAAREEDFNFLRWLPVTGSVTLMAMVAFVSAVNMAELKSAAFWRQHTFEVILNAQAFQDNLIDIQRGARGYATMGDTNALESYQASLKLEPDRFDHLVTLTTDNPSQQQRLKRLAAAMNEVFSYDERVIALYRQSGPEAVVKTDVTGESRRVFGDARDAIKAFSLEEKKLLDGRDASEQVDYHNAAHLLVLGSVLAALLLVLASLMTSHEMNRRRRVEMEREKLIGELRQALMEVKTLSGMIPICGWCKSVRSDKGYWQTVEQYVAAHTDATFSHGMCPNCAEKFTADITKADRH
jgi:CHASE3 domain sensor protein